MATAKAPVKKVVFEKDKVTITHELVGLSPGRTVSLRLLASDVSEKALDIKLSPKHALRWVKPDDPPNPSYRNSLSDPP
jgi:hypothetical protein